MAVDNIDENLTPVLLSAMRTCFVSHLLVLVSVLVLLQMVFTTILLPVSLVMTERCETTITIHGWNMRDTETTNAAHPFMPPQGRIQKLSVGIMCGGGGGKSSQGSLEQRKATRKLNTFAYPTINCACNFAQWHERSECAKKSVGLLHITYFCRGIPWIRPCPSIYVLIKTTEPRTTSLCLRNDVEMRRGCSVLRVGRASFCRKLLLLMLTWCLKMCRNSAAITRCRLQ